MRREQQRSGGRSDVERSAWLLAWLLVLAPLVLALVAALALADDRGALVGDDATLEIRILHALRGEQWVGPYSRYGWSHPGPLYFYLLAPLYELAGRSTLSLTLAALAINGLAWGWLVTKLGFETPDPRCRGLVYLVLASFLLAFRDSELIVTPLMSIWNPDVAMLPFGALIVAVSILGAGSFRLLPLVVFLHAFVTQTHVGFAIPATLALLVGVGAAVRNLRSGSSGGWPPPSPERPWLWSGLAVGVACWSLPLADQLWGQRNLLEIVRFFVFGERTGTPWLGALETASMRLSDPIFAVADLIPVWSGDWTILRHVYSAMLLIGLISAIRKARREGRRFESVLATTLLLLILTAVPLLTQLGPRDPEYLSGWLLMLSALALIAVAKAWSAPASGNGSRAAVGAVTALLLLIALGVHTHRVRERLPVASARFATMTTDVRHLAELVQPFLTHPGSAVLAADDRAMSRVAGVICLLYKRGFDPLLDGSPRMRILMGDGFEYRSSPSSWIHFSGTRRPEGELLGRGQSIWVYRLERGSER